VVRREAFLSSPPGKSFGYWLEIGDRSRNPESFSPKLLVPKQKRECPEGENPGGFRGGQREYSIIIRRAASGATGGGSRFGFLGKSRRKKNESRITGKMEGLGETTVPLVQHPSKGEGKEVGRCQDDYKTKRNKMTCGPRGVRRARKGETGRYGTSYGWDGPKRRSMGGSAGLSVEAAILVRLKKKSSERGRSKYISACLLAPSQRG